MTHYTVWVIEAGLFGDDLMIFEGTLEECLAIVGEDSYIVEPDGFTVYEAE